MATLNLLSLRNLQRFVWLLQDALASGSRLDRDRRLGKIIDIVGELWVDWVGKEGWCDWDGFLDRYGLDCGGSSALDVGGTSSVVPKMISMMMCWGEIDYTVSVSGRTGMVVASDGGLVGAWLIRERECLIFRVQFFNFFIFIPNTVVPITPMMLTMLIMPMGIDGM